MDILSHVRRMFAYEQWGWARAIISIESSRQAIDQAGVAALGPPYERAVAIFTHTQMARQAWLSRISTLAVFPEDGLWAEYFATLRIDAFDKVVNYTSTEGHACAVALLDILTHVANHSTYHRGQIATLVAATGTKPAVTDFIAFARQA